VKRLAAAAVLAVAATVAVACGSDEPAGDVVVRECKDRAGDRPLEPREGRDAVFGPIAFYELPGQFDPENRGKVGQLNGPPMKALALVRGAETVTIAVPEAQREWMQLFYEETAYAGGEGSYSVEFHGCGDDFTEFPGEIYVDHAAAPRQGRCARLSVRARGSEPVEGELFEALC
jgi:hypothetical protein